MFLKNNPNQRSREQIAAELFGATDLLPKPIKTKKISHLPSK